MSVFASLAALALRPVLDGLAHSVGFGVSEKTIEGVANFILQRFTDQSTRLVQALQRANEQAWRSLEIALAGESLLSRLDRVDQKNFREFIRKFLDGTALNFSPKAADFRTACLKELRAARTAGVFVRGFDPKQAASRTADFVRYAQPTQQLELEWQTLGTIAELLRQQGCTNLARFLELRIRPDSAPLLAVSVRFFFRREVESDPQLFQGLVYDQIDQLGHALQTGFAALQVALREQGKALRDALDSIEAIVVQTHAAVLDVQQELKNQGEQHRELYQQVLQLHQKLDLQQRELQPRDSLSLRSDAERQLVKQLVARYRKLPEKQRERLPALLNAIGKLEVVAGDLQAAELDFTTVLSCVTDNSARGEAHYNAYLTLLEQRRLGDALGRLKHALACDAERFAPFPLDKYEPQRILGAGGFGVTFLCKYRPTGGDVAVKVLLVDGMERDVRTVFQEAAALDRISHPVIIGLRECGFADAEQRRPYLVMNYFEGLTLDEYVAKHGTLSVAQLFGVAQPIAEALQAAHGSGILHRDVKPANVLVRYEGGRWQVKLIDFGLALKQKLLTTAASSGTSMGHSIAGTVDYAAPEQMGRLPGVAVGPAADVYGFGKTCCFALFRTPTPSRSHWQQVHDALGAFLEDCLRESPQQRLADFRQVLRRLSEALRPPTKVLPPAPPPREVERHRPPPIPVAIVKEQPLILEAIPTARPAPVAPPPVVLVPLPKATVLSEREAAEERRRREDSRRLRERDLRPPPLPKPRSYRVWHTLFGILWIGTLGGLMAAWFSSEQYMLSTGGIAAGCFAVAGGLVMALLNSRWGILLVLGCSLAGGGFGTLITDNSRSYPTSGSYYKLPDGRYVDKSNPAWQTSDYHHYWDRERWRKQGESIIACAFFFTLVGLAVAVPIKLLVLFVRLVSGVK